jgi:hypothetical protein
MKFSLISVLLTKSLIITFIIKNNTHIQPLSLKLTTAKTTKKKYKGNQTNGSRMKGRKRSKNELCHCPFILENKL